MPTLAARPNNTTIPLSRSIALRHRRTGAATNESVEEGRNWTMTAYKATRFKLRMGSCCRGIRQQTTWHGLVRYSFDAVWHPTALPEDAFSRRTVENTL